MEEAARQEGDLEAGDSLARLTGGAIMKVARVRIRRGPD
jgi:hypothetical protein